MDELTELAETIRQPIVLPLALGLSGGVHGEGLHLGKDDQTLSIEITNALDAPIRLALLDQEGDAYHLRVSFRPQTFANPDEVRLSEASRRHGWSIRQAPAAGGRQAFLLVGPGGRSLDPGIVHTIELENLRPDPALGARQTQVSVNYDNMQRTPEDILRGHLLGRLSVIELGDQSVPLRWARSGGAGFSPLLMAVPNSAFIKENGKTSILVNIFNISGRDLPMTRVGTNKAPRIRMPFLQPPIHSGYLNNQGIVRGFKLEEVTSDFFTLDSHARELTPIKEFVWPAQSAPQLPTNWFNVSLEFEGYSACRDYALLIEYENFGESGTEAGEMILEFQTTGVYPANKSVTFVGDRVHFGDETPLNPTLGWNEHYLQLTAPLLALSSRGSSHHTVGQGKTIGFGGSSAEEAPLRISFGKNEKYENLNLEFPARLQVDGVVRADCIDVRIDRHHDWGWLITADHEGLVLTYKYHDERYLIPRSLMHKLK